MSTNPFSRFVSKDDTNLPTGLDSANLSQTNAPGAVIDSESLVVASLLANNSWFPECLRLTKDHFGSEIWRTAFASIVAIYSSDRSGKLFVDAHRLSEHAGMDVGMLQRAKSCENVEAFRGHINAVTNAFGLRRTSEICSQATEAAACAHADAKDVLNLLGTEIQKIYSDTTPEVEFDYPLSMQRIKITANEIDAIEQGQEPEGDPLECIQTGLEALDRKGGLLVRGVHILAGTPGSGKTALADAICRFVSVSGGGALLWSQELSSDFILRRSIAAQAGIPQDVLTRRNFEYATPSESLSRVIDLETVATDGYAVLAKTRRINDLRGDVLAYIRKHGKAPDVLALDYLQITDVSGGGRDEMRYRALGRLGEELCALAKDFKCAVIALSQLSVDAGQEPNMFSLRESKDLAQSATSVVLLHKLPDNIQNEHKAMRGHGDLVKLIVPKIRSTAPFTDHITFDGRYLRFDSMPVGYEPPSPPAAAAPKISSRY